MEYNKLKFKALHSEWNAKPFVFYRTRIERKIFVEFLKAPLSLHPTEINDPETYVLGGKFTGAKKNL